MVGPGTKQMTIDINHCLIWFVMQKTKSGRFNTTVISVCYIAWEGKV